MSYLAPGDRAEGDCGNAGRARRDRVVAGSVHADSDGGDLRDGSSDASASAHSPGRNPQPRRARDGLVDAALLAVGGGVGALARHLMTTGASDAPLALWGINVVGSLLLGVVTGAALPLRARLAVGTGLLGSFTSYSALATFTADGVKASAWGSALSSVVVGVVAAAAGLALGARARGGVGTGAAVAAGTPERGVPLHVGPHDGAAHSIPPCSPQDGLGQERASQDGAP